MSHTCAACKCKGEEPSEDQNGVIPPGWFTRCIDDTDYVLCDVCGASIHFRGAISPYLTDCLELMDGARCDMSGEVQALGRRRRAQRKG